MVSRLALLFALVLPLSAITATSAQGRAKEDAWLDELYVSVAADLSAGKPLVVEVQVPLCDNTIIWCGNDKLGRGEDADRNLYWSTSAGFKGWFGRSKAWKQVDVTRFEKGPILERRVWKRRMASNAHWRSLGVKASFDVYVIANAWRGQKIGDAMRRYTSDLYGSEERLVELGDGTQLSAGGAAHVVAYVGHNGWMDVAPYKWSAIAKKYSHDREEGARAKKGTIAIACLTADYLADPVADEERVPLLMTASLLFAGAHGFEGAVSAFASGGGFAQIRKQAAENYGRGQEKPYTRVRSNFTNPSDRRWRRYLKP